MWHADTGDDPRRADAARADPDLHAVRARPDQRLGCLACRDVARDDLDAVRQFADTLDGGGDHFRMAVRGVDDDQVALGVDQRLGPREARIADRRRACDAQAPGGVLGRTRVSHCLFDVLDGDQADAAIIFIDYQQLLDAPLMQQPPRIFLRDACADGRKVLAGHQLADGLRGVARKAHIAVGEDADQPPRRLDHRNARDAMARHELLRIAQRLVGKNRDRVDDHAAFEALDRAHRRALFLDGQIAVKDTEPAELCHNDRHVGLGHRVHCRRQHRNVERNVARDPRPRVGLAR